MKDFLGEDFLLDSELAEKLFTCHAKELPIIDYHCHIDAEDIAYDRTYENPAQIMLGGDHYKWRLMRAAGIDESLITGSATDKDKFLAFAEALELAAGNPVYHWTHLELKRYFGFEGNLNSRTAEQVWDLCCSRLQNGLSVRQIIQDSHVEVICTTDDPADDLAAHKICKADDSLQVDVRPTYRPDKAINIHKNGFSEYIRHLGDVSDVCIDDLKILKDVLANRLDYFVEHGCIASDHGLDQIWFAPCSEKEAEQIFAKAMQGGSISLTEAKKYVTNMMLFLGRLYSKHDMVMQIHFGAMRNVNTCMMGRLGPDTGFDCINDTGCGESMAFLLDALHQTSALPKTILYSLNPTDNALIDSIAGSFFETGIRSKVHHGAAWWYNDNIAGIMNHLKTYASITPIGTFLGMLTDSRCFLSFSRHEFFRRIFCSWLADCVENGEFPYDEELLGKLVQDVSYHNCKSYFGF